VQVFLIHGMGRTRASLLLLGRRLEQAGHSVSSFGYMVARDPLDVIAHKFRAHLEQHARGEFAIIGHSLGNVVTRMLLPLSGALEGKLSRLIMLAPPNQPPVIARALDGNPIFSALTKDAGKKLADAAFYARLPLPSVPTLIVAGRRGPKASWLPPFRGRPSDGVVCVEETRLPGVPHVEVPAIHTFIMNDKEVFALAVRFLEHGRLATPDAPR
jgi:hypothetical protein